DAAAQGAGGRGPPRAALRVRLRGHAGPFVRASRMIHLNRRSYPYMEEVNEGVLREFRRLGGPRGRVLDVGCGRGQLGEAIRALGWEVGGMEQAGEACATAEKLLDRLVQPDRHDQGRVERGGGGAH